MAKDYVEDVEGAYRVAGSRVSLESKAESRRRNADLITRLLRARHECQIPG